MKARGFIDTWAAMYCLFMLSEGKEKETDHLNCPVWS